MKLQRLFSTMRPVFAVAVLVVFVLGMTSLTFASQEKILHAFLGHHASNPSGSLVFDKAGNLYGTSGTGGNNCPTVCGIVFELSPTSTGWDYKVIHVFNGGTDGVNPAGLIIDAAGNLYGTTSEGGTLTCFGQNYGCGTVFELSPGTNGSWTESILYRFTGDADGATPLGNVTMDAAGNLYGTAFSGGSQACLPPFGCGTVYELSPGANGWTETTLYTFTGAGDGWQPYLNVAFDAQGNLYATTGRGGSNNCALGCGGVFELSPSSSGWSFGSIYEFTNGSDGSFPSNLLFDSKGNLWGIGAEGGIMSTVCIYGCGTVFELSPSNGSWNFTSIWEFNSADGAIPSGIVLDSAGNVFGTTLDGGGNGGCQFQGCGVVFELTPAAGGWTESVLNRFGSKNGSQPDAGVVLDSAGNLYGTTNNGSPAHYGLVFEIVR